MTAYLLDTNCFIQLVRQRPEAPQVQMLLQGIPPAKLYMTDFTLHSIGVIMNRFGQVAGYSAFLTGLGIGSGFGVAHVEVSELNRVSSSCTKLGLDFDDAYQYAAAELRGLTLVSLDTDFDRTPRGRLTPAAALQQFTDEQKQRIS
jgi:predicted nucleic acid-binding protein